MPTDVLRLAEHGVSDLLALLEKFGISLKVCEVDTVIPGSYWGDDEAGLIGNRLYARGDTPIHSILHEASHFICMDPARRNSLDTDAGSDDAEENAVCYLQVLLADELPILGRERIFADMDAWGYSFRLGSTRCWFDHDAGEALDWLIRHRLIDNGWPNYAIRQHSSP